jgi:hypothetical protein
MAPPHVVEKATKLLASNQIPEGSYLYGRYLWTRPRMGINLPKGSACRTPGNDYALELFGQPPKRGAYVESLENLCTKYVGFQQIAVHRPIPHEAWYNISGYFYLYGFYYAAVVLNEKLPEDEQRRLFPALARGVLYCKEKDGSFWDTRCTTTTTSTGRRTHCSRCRERRRGSSTRRSRSRGAAHYTRRVLRGGDDGRREGRGGGDGRGGAAARAAGRRGEAGRAGARRAGARREDSGRRAGTRSIPLSLEIERVAEYDEGRPASRSSLSLRRRTSRRWSMRAAVGRARS